MLGIPRHIGNGTAPTFAKRRQEMIARITLTTIFLLFLTLAPFTVNNGRCIAAGL
jgi:hypothetical protein